jgi:predicted TIM-barrel fold metal-dependent hydrolase
VADRAAAAHPDTLIPFGSVDPLAGEAAVRRARRLISEHAVRGLLFGTDYPLLTPERWLGDFELLDIKPEVRPKILKHNAVRLLGLGG